MNSYFYLCLALIAANILVLAIFWKVLEQDRNLIYKLTKQVMAKNLPEYTQAETAGEVKLEVLPGGDREEAEIERKRVYGKG